MHQDREVERPLEQEETNEKIFWNPDVKLIISDVDETIAEVYTPAEPGMLHELSAVLQEGIGLYLISGASLESITDRIIGRIDPALRKNILVGHCSGAEVWGFDQQGTVLPKPYYSEYDMRLSIDQKEQFRHIVQQLISEFQLKTFDPLGDKASFREMTHNNPRSIMYVDRGPQITMQFTNAYNLTPELAQDLAVPLTHDRYDMRYPVIARSIELFDQAGIPITARTGGTTAIDFAVEGVSKQTAVEWAMDNEELLKHFGLTPNSINENPKFLEVWGDKFSTINGGTDRHICEGLSNKVRAIDFRDEPKEELLRGYNIQIWHGEKHLHNGLLEYLQSRHTVK